MDDDDDEFSQKRYITVLILLLCFPCSLSHPFSLEMVSSETGFILTHLTQGMSHIQGLMLLL